MDLSVKEWDDDNIINNNDEEDFNELEEINTNTHNGLKGIGSLGTGINQNTNSQYPDNFNMNPPQGFNQNNISPKKHALPSKINKDSLTKPQLSEADQKKIDDSLNKLTKITNNDIMNFEQVAIRKSLFFRWYISGSVEVGNFNDTAPIKVKYEFVHGSDWEKEDGLVKDESQFSCKGDGTYHYYCYNQQFEISFRSINPYGWPQLVLTCCTIDNNGNEVVKGYGCLHVPASKGRHERKVNIFSTTNDQSFWGKFWGKTKSDEGGVTSTPKVISSGEGREISRAINEGWLKIVFQIGFRDMDKFGYISN